MSKLSDLKHPRQPIGVDERGTVRFKPNAVLRWLVDNKHVNLNAIDPDDFPPGDVKQFWQLLGYSVSAWGSLDFVDLKTARACDKAAAKLADEEAKAKGAARKRARRRSGP